MCNEVYDILQQARALRLKRLKKAINKNGLLRPLDVALVGATGVGKSSTLNALFGSNVAKVGTGYEPETQFVSEYRVNNVFRLHDSAGFGDGKEADEGHAKNLINLLKKTCHVADEEYFFVDLAIVILDGGSRDLGTTYQLLTNIVLPNIEADRVLVAINQADMAMSGRHWDYEKSEPTPRLLEFLKEKARSTKARIKEATGMTIPKPVYYSAEHGYNIDKLFKFIIKNLPENRRYIKR